MKIFNQIVFLYLFLACLSYFLKLVVVHQHSIIVYGVGYLIRYYLPKVVPIFLFSIYLGSELFNNHKRLIAAINELALIIIGVSLFLQKLKQAFHKFFIGLFFLSIVTLSMFIFGCATQLPISVFLGAFRWSYTALITWNTVFIFAFILMWLKTRNPFLSAVFGSLTISAGGLLYELPLYPIVPSTDIYFHHTYPLFIATKWFSVVFLVWLLYRLKWRMNFPFFITAWLYVMFSIIHIAYPFRFFPVWLPRLPASIMLLTIPFGLKKCEKWLT